jgi:hypothetical protein
MVNQDRDRARVAAGGEKDLSRKFNSVKQFQAVDRNTREIHRGTIMPLSSRWLSAFFAMAAVIALATQCSGAPSDETIRIRNSSGFASRSLEARGTIEFTDDDRDVKTISPGGYVLIEAGTWLRTERSYEVRADSSGSLSRTYRVGGRARAMDADAQGWAAAGILTLIRETGMGAGPRIGRLLRQGGPPAVLKEVSEIHSDGPKRTYLRELIERGRLNADQLRDAMRSARTIGSDGEKTSLLIEVSRSYLKPDLRQSWFTTLGGIGSDGDKRRGLEHAIRSDPSVDTLALTASAAGRIGSDGDKAAVLAAIASRGIIGGVRRPWFRALETIGSDGDKRQVLLGVLAALGGDQDTLLEILRTAETIGSNGDKAAVLSAAARADLRSDFVQRAFFSAVDTIGSDGDRKDVLTSVLRTSNQAAPLITGVAQSARKIGSDGDKAAVLSRAAEFDLNDAAARAAFFVAVNTIGSDHDRADVLSSVLRKPKLVRETIVAAIDSAAAMGSDGDKASVLLLAAERHASDSTVRPALERALQSVHSDGDYRRVSAALLR